MIAIRHGNPMVQLIGKAMLLDQILNPSHSSKSLAMDDAFVAAAISTALPPELNLTSDMGGH